MMRQDVTLAVVIGVLACVLTGYAAAGGPGGAVGLLLGAVLLVVQWWRLPLWSWLALYLTRRRAIELSEPISAANDRRAAGVRYQGGVAVTAIQVLGKSFKPAFLSGSATTETDNVLEITSLFAGMQQSLGLKVESISVISAGARHHAVGDFPAIYGTLVGTPPYAGSRETWLVVRIRAADNAEALRWRHSAGTAAVAATQRIAACLDSGGIRARLATATEITALDRRLGSTSLTTTHRGWRSVKDSDGWLTTYAYRPGDITTEVLAQAWTLKADGIIQNVTLFPDRTASASVTVRTPQPATAPPRVCLDSLPGRQALAVANNLAGPRTPIRGQRRAALAGEVEVPIGPSGVLLGRIADGSRIALPLVDPRDSGRLQLDADDSITKRLLIRAAAAGERITVHSTNPARWESLRMPNLLVTTSPRPAAGTTISVQDGSVTPSPQPGSVISVGAGRFSDTSDGQIAIEQTGPAAIRLSTPDHDYDIEVDLFRVENRYAPMYSATAAVPASPVQD